MAVSLNHTIVHAHDNLATAQFLTEILNLPARSTLSLLRWCRSVKLPSIS